MVTNHQSPITNYQLSMSVQFVKGVGPVRARAFAGLGVETLGDLLEYFPRDWSFLPEPIKINQMRPGAVVTIAAVVESVDYHPWRKHPIFEVFAADDTGMCRIIWFHGGFLRNALAPGAAIIASGKVVRYKHQLQLTNPKFIKFDPDLPPDVSRTKTAKAEIFGAGLVGAVYPACAQLSNNQIKRIIRPLLDKLDELVEEFYDSRFRKKADLVERSRALEWILAGLETR